jgi:ABC-2 type transport system ATP-binding protein
VSEAIVRARGLTKRFGDVTAVESLDLFVAPGSVFAFLGANGSGKTTTIRMLIGVLEPTAGWIEVDGVDVIRHPRRVRDRIGYMGQRVSLYSGLTLWENVEFYGGLHGLAGSELRRCWEELRDRFGLAEVEDERTEELSAGLRQKAGLALAMLHRPRLLFLDEPTAGVDVHSRAVFWQAIREEVRAGTTVFVTTHYVEEADLCDRVFLIHRGRCLAEDTPDGLRARFADGYRIRIRGSGTSGLAPRLAEALAAEVVRVQAGEVELWRPQLDGTALEELDRFHDRRPDIDIRLEPMPIAEIFRRLLRAQGER